MNIYILDNIIERMVDILLPKVEQVKILETLGPIGLTERISPAHKFTFETEKIKAIFSYKDKLCRQAVWEIKYRANPTLIRNFSLILYDYILDDISDLQTFVNFRNIVLVPVPSSKSSTRQKGFNHCFLLVQELIEIDKQRGQNNFTFINNFLSKKVNTGHQSKTKTRKDRFENLKNTFIVNKANDFNLNEYSYILIDDVITTGATMNESFRALKEAGAKKIIGFALAH